MSSYCIITIGCQMNKADSEFYGDILKKHGFSDATADVADVVMVNTCAVREVSVHKLESKLGELFKRKRKTGLPLIGVIGCVPAIDPGAFKKRFKQVDFVLGTYSDKRMMEQGLKEALGLADEVPVEAKASSVSAFVPITYGCDCFCTYCIVPHVRGRLVSRPQEEIISEARGLVQKGAKEIILLGQNVNAYGKDRGEKDAFADLLKKVGDIPGLVRLKFITSHPKDTTVEGIKSLRHINKLAWYFHFPLQAGSDEVLRRMNRGYTLAQYKELVAQIRETFPRAGITTDIIVGFPGETLAQFEETLQALRDIRFDNVYAAMYSMRPKTPASNFEGQIEKEELHRRVNTLFALQKEITFDVAKECVGKTCEVLIEKNKGERSIGLSEMGRMIEIKGIFEVGTIVETKIVGPGLGCLKGEAIDAA